MIFIIIVIIWMLGSSFFSRMFGSVWRSKQHGSDKTLQGSGILAFRGVKLKIFKKITRIKANRPFNVCIVREPNDILSPWGKQLCDGLTYYNG